MTVSLLVRLAAGPDAVLRLVACCHRRAWEIVELRVRPCADGSREVALVVRAGGLDASRAALVVDRLVDVHGVVADDVADVPSGVVVGDLRRRAPWRYAASVLT